MTGPRNRETRSYMEAEGFSEEQILVALLNQGILSPSLTFVAFCIGEENAARMFAEELIRDRAT